jgi:hypothetical protein
MHGLAQAHWLLVRYAWYGIVGITALITGLVGLGATPALADDVEWRHPYDPETANIETDTIAADTTGVYVYGYSFADFQHASQRRLFLQKLDLGGNVAWTFQSAAVAGYFPALMAVAENAVVTTHLRRRPSEGRRASRGSVSLLARWQPTSWSG